MADNPNTNEKELHDWAIGLVEDGRNARRAHEGQWWENIASFCGDLWSEWDPHRGVLNESIPLDHKVRIPINLIQPAVRTEYSKLLKNRPIVNCIARSGGQKDLNSADVGNKMLNDYGEKKHHKPKVRRRTLQWVLLCGLGGIFVDHDPTAVGTVEILVDPEGNPIFDPAMIKAVQRHYRDKHRKPKTKEIPQGELRIRPLGPFSLIWDFSELDFDDAKWCIVTEVYDVDEVFRRWKVEVEADDSVAPGVIERRLLMRADLSGALGKEFGPPKTQRLMEVHRLFIKPGHRYFKQGAEIVFNKEGILDKTTFPFSDGELPVATMGHIFAPWSQHPMSIVEQVKPVVLELSKTESQMIENRNLMANPPWIEFEQNAIEGEIQNKPGMRLKLRYAPNVPEPHPIEMPDLPVYVKDLPNLLGEHILEITGQNETSQGQVPPGARSGVAIAYLTEENDTKLGPTVQEYEEMIERAARLELSRYGEFYDAPRTIHIYKPHSDPEVFDFIGSTMEGVVGVNVQAGSALPRSLAAKQQFTLDLYDRGLIRNPRQVLEMLELGQGEKEEWEEDMDQAERENRAMELGEEKEVLEWYNHAAHLYVHHRKMKSAEWEEYEQPIKDAYTQHEAEHQQFIRDQQQQQMRDQTMAAGGANGNGNGPGGTANGNNQPPPSGQYSSPDNIGSVAGAANQQDYQPQ